jgi:hypothetical protein
MRKPVLVVTAYFVDSVEARLKQDFELRRKKNGPHFTPEELVAAADGADAMFVTPADRLDALAALGWRSTATIRIGCPRKLKETRSFTITSMICSKSAHF